MGSEAFQLEHNQQFTNKELTVMIGEATLDIFAREREKWRRLPNRFGDIHLDVIKWLVAHKGFCRIEYEVNWWVDSSNSIFDKTSWYHDDDKDKLGIIADMVNAAGYDRTDDGYLLGGDIRTYLFTQNPQTIEEAKRIIIGCFSNKDLSYEDIMSRTTLNLSSIVKICREHKDDSIDRKAALSS